MFDNIQLQIDRDWVIRVIQTTTSLDHFRACDNLVTFFLTKWHSRVCITEDYIEVVKATTVLQNALALKILLSLKP